MNRGVGGGEEGEGGGGRGGRGGGGEGGGRERGGEGGGGEGGGGGWSWQFAVLYTLFQCLHHSIAELFITAHRESDKEDIISAG